MQHFLKSPIDNIHKIFTAFLLIMVLAGCGFHLRGNYIFPDIMQHIYISPDDPLQPFQKNVRRILQRNNVAISQQQNAEIPTLHLSEPVFSEQVLAITADAQNQRLRITMSLNYQVTLGNKTLRDSTGIQSFRDVSINPTAPITGENERSLIKDELLKEGANQLLRQLTTINHVEHAEHTE